MTPQRYRELSTLGNFARLTKEEMREGWHFCPEWDDMVTRIADPDGEQCDCKPWTRIEIRNLGE